MPDLAAIRRTLRTHGQEHLLRFYDQLDPAGQTALLGQLDQLDFDHLDRLIGQYVLHRPQVGLPDRLEPVPVISPETTDAQELEAARRRGREQIAHGKVAAFVVAGGQGTRLGIDDPKGCLEATPVARKSLFQLFAEQILAARRKSGAAIPWYVMTSPDNDVAVRCFFRRHNWFGLPEEDVFFLVQGTMPAVDFKGKLLLAEKGKLASSPNGHGGSLQALRDSEALHDMRRRGIELISYFHVDNPLVHCIDPLFLGLHHREGAEMSAKCLPKRSPTEPLGNLCMGDGRVMVIEYSDMPEELARSTTEQGRLRFRAGSIGVHVISRSFVERLTADGRCELPFHRAEKKVPCIDEQGRPVQPEEPNAVKLEMFVFDALPLARSVVVLETDRCEEFSPIKNRSGEDSLATSLHDQVRRAATWLEAAGVRVPRDAEGQVAAALEISPLFADSAEELAEKVDPNMTITTGDRVYLGQRGQVGAER